MLHVDELSTELKLKIMLRFWRGRGVERRNRMFAIGCRPRESEWQTPSWGWVRKLFNCSWPVCWIGTTANLLFISILLQTFPLCSPLSLLFSNLINVWWFSISQFWWKISTSSINGSSLPDLLRISSNHLIKKIFKCSFNQLTNWPRAE